MPTSIASSVSLNVPFTSLSVGYRSFRIAAIMPGTLALSPSVHPKPRMHFKRTSKFKTHFSYTEKTSVVTKTLN